MSSPSCVAPGIACQLNPVAYAAGTKPSQERDCLLSPTGNLADANGIPPFDQGPDALRAFA